MQRKEDEFANADPASIEISFFFSVIFMSNKSPIQIEKGSKFSRWTVIDRCENKSTASRGYFWNCMCDCGTTKTVSAISLRSNDSKSCGCLQREIAKAAGDRTRTHGLSKTSIYSIWSTMIARCTRTTAKDYSRYGGAGISVCTSWLVFENFYADMGDRPNGLSLDRVDNSKGYSPENCRWADGVSQQRNKNNNRIIHFNGKGATVAEWAEIVGLNYVTLLSRLKAGWTPEKALTTKVKRHAKQMRM